MATGIATDDLELRAATWAAIETLRGRLVELEAAFVVRRMRWQGFYRKAERAGSLDAEREELWRKLTAAREFLYEAFLLPERSMIPSFLAGDRVLVNKLRGRRVFPERGDVIVFRNPDPAPGTGRNFIKRVIAVAAQMFPPWSHADTLHGQHRFEQPVVVRELQRVVGVVALPCRFQRPAQGA